MSTDSYYFSTTFKKADEFLKLTRNELLEVIRFVPDLAVFRGIGNSKWPLLPTAFREPGIRVLQDISGHENFYANQQYSKTSRYEQLSRLEMKSLALFVRYADKYGGLIPFLSHDINTKLTGLYKNSILQDFSNFDVRQWPQNEFLPYLALAQHYGIPTRLLDFTDSHLIAAWFAAYSALNIVNSESIPAKEKPESFCVWVLMTYQPFIPKNNKNLPYFEVIRLPLNTSVRIRSQEALFTIFNHDSTDDIPTQSLDSIPPTEGFGSCLGKIQFPIDQAIPLLNELDWKGIHHAKLFPGLEGVAQHTVWNGQLRSQTFAKLFNTSDLLMHSLLARSPSKEDPQQL